MLSLLASPREGHQHMRSRSVVVAPAGTPARLQVERDHVRISLPVICLQNGKRGQTIRVRTIEGRRVMRAKVMGEGTMASSE